MKHVIVIEDDTDIAFLLLHRIKRDPLLKVTTLHFPTAQAALNELVWTFRPEREVIGLIDLMLPDYSGVQVANWVRDNIGDEVKLIALTAAGEHSTIYQEAEDSGLFDYVMTKPISYDELHKAIRGEA